MTRAQEFELLRPLLFAIAYRILGSVSEAEDAVQETWLRFDTSPTQPTSTKAFLSAVVTRISIDVLRSARVRREEYVGPWFPEPLLTDPYEDPERSAELADSLSMAALLLLERHPAPTAIDVPALLTAVESDDARARDLRATLARAICGVLAAVVAFCDPAIVVIGETWGAAPVVLDTTATEFERLPRHVPIRAARLTDAPSLAGARNHALHELQAAIATSTRSP